MTFHKNMLKGILLLAAMTLPVAAQTTTQGAIGGTVEDATEAAIPNAAITIHNDGTNAEVKVVSDASGYFKASTLEPGSYTVTIAAPSFGTYKASGVMVQVGQTVDLTPHLAAGSTEQVVTVSSDAPVLNYESPDLSAVLPTEALVNVPVQNRRWSALALTTPGVVADSSGFGLVSVRGMSTLLNNVEIDGADDNQAYFSEERGRTREGYSTSTNAVREFEVNSGVYSAQYGRAAGGVINSVTRSGTNTLHGDLQFTDLDRGFGGYVPGSVDPFGHPLKPKDLRKIYGGSVGGALMKDKLFWFYTYDQLTHIFPGISKAAQYGSATTVGTFLEQPDPTVTGCAISDATMGTVQVTGAASHSALDTQVCAYALRTGVSYAQGATNYNAGVNALLTDLGTVPRAGYQEINTPKLDWQINQKNRVSFLLHRLRWDAPGDVQTSSAASYSVDAFGNDFVKLDYGLTKLDSVITSNISNEILYQYSRELNDEGQQTYSAYTLANLVAPGASIAGGPANAPGGTVPYIGLNTSIGFNMGSPYYSYRIAYPGERKWQISDILYWQHGNHSLRFGGDFVHNEDLLQQTPYYYGDYSYSSVANYLSDLSSKGHSGTCNFNGLGVGTAGTTNGFYGCYSGIFQDYGATSFEMGTLDSGYFIQDNWKVTPHLTLELGLRYDYQKLPAAPTNLTSATGSFVPYTGIANVPSDKNNFGPRIGFSYDVFGKGNTVLRGGYGIYYGRILNGTVASVQFGSGSPNGQYGTATLKPATCTGSGASQVCAVTAGVPNFPNPMGAGAGSKPSSFFLAPNMQNPQVHEFDLQLQQSVGKGTVVQFSYLGALGRELPNFLDVNWAPPQDTSTITIGTPSVTTFGTGPLTPGNTYSVPVFGTCALSATCPNPTGYLNTNFTNITEVISNINSVYNGGTVEVQNRSLHGLTFDANYTWSHALDFNQNASSTTSTNNWLNPYASARQNYGVSQFNVGNRFVTYVLYTIPGTENMGQAVKWLSKGWSVNDTFQMQNGLPYSAKIASGSAASVSLNSTSWNGSTGANYLPVAGLGLNNFQGPRGIVDDMRLQKSVFFADKYELRLNADMYNVANHENFSTSDINASAYTFTGTTGSSSTLTFSPKTTATTGFQSHSTANDSGFLFTPRNIQIGAHLVF